MSNYFQTIRRWFGGYGSTGQYQGIQRIEPTTQVYEDNRQVGIDGALQVSAVWACVEFIADNIASLPYFVYRRQKGQDGHKELARDTLLWAVLHEKPNRWHTPMEFWQFMVMNYVLRGNAYARKILNDNGEVIELWPLAADQVQVESLPDKSIVYKYLYNGVVSIYSDKSIFHWRDKGNGLVGMSRLEFMNSSVGVAIDAQKHAAKQFRSAGKRPGVFMMDKLLTKTQRAQIRENYAGLTDGGESDIHILEAGAKFEPLGLTPQDMQLLETQKFSVEDIGRWFGLSSVVLNDTSKTTTWGTGIGQIIEGIYKFRLRTILVSLEQTIERRIFTAGQLAIFCGEFSLDALLRGSYMERLDAGAKAVQNGLQKRNEWRQFENLPPDPHGDVLTAQSNLVPLEMLGKVTPKGGSSDGTQSPTAQ